MNNNLILGSLYGVAAQIITYLQLQGNVKYGWYKKYPIPLLLLSIPIAYLFIKSVEHFVKAYNGEVTPSRLIGFSIGMVVFMIMSWIMFKEPITVKTFVCLLLSVAILVIQICWK